MQQALGRPQSEPLPQKNKQTNKKTKNQHFITVVSQAGIFHLKKEVKYVLKKKIMWNGKIQEGGPTTCSERKIAMT